MELTIAIKHIESRTNYTGLDDGAVPVKVYRTAKFTVAHVTEPSRDTFLNNDFRTVKFVDQSNGQLFTSPLLDAHYDRLAFDLASGATAVVEYEVGTGWIKSLNGKRWN